MIVYLNVPFSQKDEAKKLGARWNPEKKKWYLESPNNLAEFIRWIPREEVKKLSKSPPPVVAENEDDLDGVLKIWADGSCHPNPGPGGWGWITSDGDSRFGGEEETTNNRMEMTAILEAMSVLPDGERVIIYSDSEYCVKGLTIWRPKWQKKKWMKKGEPMINQDLWLLLEEQLVRLRVTVKWIKGHNGNEGNEAADLLAEKGREMVRFSTHACELLISAHY